MTHSHKMKCYEDRDSRHDEQFYVAMIWFEALTQSVIVP